LNGANPETHLTDILAKIAAGHPISRISELMPWVYRPSTRPPPDHARHRTLTPRAQFGLCCAWPPTANA
jgi:hypothetical protein